jgi:hypothetical protein
MRTRAILAVAAAALLLPSLCSGRKLRAPDRGSLDGSARQGTGDVALPFDGGGHTLYPTCARNTAGYGRLEEVFQRCAVACSEPAGCPTGCCLSSVGGGQTLFCSTPGACVRQGPGGKVRFAALERMTHGGADAGRVTCDLGALAPGGEDEACAVQSVDQIEQTCAGGVHVPNTGEMVQTPAC